MPLDHSLRKCTSGSCRSSPCATKLSQSGTSIRRCNTRPDGIIGTIRDYEMLACHAMLNDSLTTLIEDSTTNPVAYIAVQEVLRYLRDASEEIPSELHKWAYDVAVGDRPPPKTGPGRSPFANQVRDAAIIQTVGILISCGLKATRNEASEPISAADAVSAALRKLEIELKPDSVNKIWASREKSHFQVRGCCALTGNRPLRSAAAVVIPDRPELRETRPALATAAGPSAT